MSVYCPHQEEAERACPGCVCVDVDPLSGEPNGRRYCNGVITGRVHRVIGKFVSITNAECSCGCDLDHEEWQAVHEEMMRLS